MGLLSPQPLNFDLLAPFIAVPGARIVTAYSVTTESTGYIEEGTLDNEVTLNGATKPTLFTAAGGGPYFVLNGSDQYLSVAHDDWNEPIIAATMICIYNPDSAQAEDLCGSYTGGGQSKMRIAIDASNNVAASITADGSTAKTATQASGYTHSTWNMAALVFSPSAYVKIWANGSATSNTTSPAATLHNTTAALYIGSATAAAALTGKIGLFAVYGTVVHDDHLDMLYAHALQFYR